MDAVPIRFPSRFPFHIRYRLYLVALAPIFYWGTRRHIGPTMGAMCAVALPVQPAWALMRNIQERPFHQQWRLR